MYYKLESAKELAGILTALSGSGSVEATYMKLDNASAKKLAAVLRKGRVTRENQELFFTSIIVKKEQMGVFLKGQTNLIKDGNKFVMTTNSRNPLRFKANLQTVVEGSDSIMYACAVEVGSIEFDLHESIPEMDGDEATFENVPAIVYPYGVYRAAILQGE